MITSAELPLNERGAVYHLDLQPDEIADQIITVGDPARVHFGDLMFQNLEMETAGILGLGQILGHRCLSISVVLANRTKGIFTENVQMGVEQLIEKSIPYLL